LCIDKTLFDHTKNKIVGSQRMRQGIGTLSEKTVHAVMKNYYAPDTDMHEIPIENFVADIYTGQEIIEIQTRAFNKMRRKLDAFLPLYPVTFIQFPISSGCRGLTRKPGRLHRNASHQRPEIPIWHLLSSIRSALIYQIQICI
jgi:hypothetical protein